MKIGMIVTPNAKGQIVIPKDIRETLGIGPQSYLQLISTGNSIIINPISDIITSTERELSYLEILKKTAGSWAGDSWPETRRKRRKIELAATKKARKAW